MSSSTWFAAGAAVSVAVAATASTVSAATTFSAATAAAVAASASTVSLASSSSSSSSSFVTFAAVAGMAASLSVVGLIALQSDVVGRWLLDPKRLQSKRYAEYKYRWIQLLECLRWSILYSSRFRGCGGSSISSYDPDEELLQTIFIKTENDAKRLIEELLDETKKKTSNNNTKGEKATESQSQQESLKISRLGIDDRRGPNSTELYVWIYRGEQKIYQISLTLLATTIFDLLERQIYKSTLCFIADASANASTDLIIQLLRDGIPRNNNGGGGSGATASVHIVQNPIWMVYWSSLFATTSSSSKLVGADTTSSFYDRVLYSLCRLEVINAALISNGSANTVVIALPGQSFVPALLPSLVRMFPSDRHVFAYTGCVETVSYGIERCRSDPSWSSLRSGTISKSFQHSLEMNHSYSYTTPYQYSRQKQQQSSSLPGNNWKRLTALSSMSITCAGIVETWIDSVNTYLSLKEDKNTSDEEYLPYVFRLDYISPSAFFTTTGSSEVKIGSDPYWSLLSLLQFITGSRSSRVSSTTTTASSSALFSSMLSKQETIDAMASVIVDHYPKEAMTTRAAESLDAKLIKAIEDAVFSQKRILIPSKTLIDTVQPTQHWTLKAALKAGGCSCCGPEEEEEEEEEDDTFVVMNMRDHDEEGGRDRDDDDNHDDELIRRGMVMKKKNTTSSSSSSSKRSNNMYVDGKTTLAFDPTKFTRT